MKNMHLTTLLLDINGSICECSSPKSIDVFLVKMFLESNSTPFGAAKDNLTAAYLDGLYTTQEFQALCPEVLMHPRIIREIESRR